VYTWVCLRKGAYILGNVKNRGRTIDQELVEFVGIVYSFLYFSMGHFLR